MPLELRDCRYIFVLDPWRGSVVYCAALESEDDADVSLAVERSELVR